MGEELNCALLEMLPFLVGAFAGEPEEDFVRKPLAFLLPRLELLSMAGSFFNIRLRVW